MQAGSQTGTTDRESSGNAKATTPPQGRSKKKSPKPKAPQNKAKGKTAGGPKPETRTARPKNDGSAPRSESNAATAASSEAVQAKNPAQTRKTKKVRRQSPPQKDHQAKQTTKPADTPTIADESPEPRETESSKPPTKSAPQSNGKKTPPAKKSPPTKNTPAKKTPPAKNSNSANRAKRSTERSRPTKRKTGAGAAKPQPVTSATDEQTEGRRPAPTTDGGKTDGGETDGGATSTITATRTTTRSASPATTSPKGTQTAKKGAPHEKASPETVGLVDGSAAEASEEQRAAFAERLSAVDDVSNDRRRVVPSSSHRVRLTSTNRRDQRPILLVVALFTQVQMTLLALLALVTGALHAIAGVEGGLLESLSIPQRVDSLSGTAEFGLNILLMSVAASSVVVLALWVFQLRSPERYEVDWLTPALPGIAVWLVAAGGFLYLKLKVMAAGSEHWLLSEGILGGLLPYLVLAVGALVAAISASQVRDPI